MGVYIKNMEMPKTCKECDFAHLSIGKVYVCDRCDDALITGVETFPIIAARPIFCPLVEIKEPHGDLIDRDALKEAIVENVYPVADCFNSRDYGMFWTGGTEKAIDGQPTIIERSKDDKI